MITKRIVFKDYDLAKQQINNLKHNYDVFSHLTITSEKGLKMIFEIKEENLNDYLSLIESLGLETY